VVGNLDLNLGFKDVTVAQFCRFKDCFVRPERSTSPTSLSALVLDMGKKGKGKAPAFLETPEALAPFSVQVRDIIATPLGVEATVVGVGSKDGALYLCWPGGIISPASPAPAKAKNKSELEAFGYARRPQSAHIQRDITERWRTQYEQRRYGKPGPKTAAIKLPLGPNGSAGSAAFAAFAASEAAKRPQTAP
jgi:hypothetical protein